MSEFNLSQYLHDTLDIEGLRRRFAKFKAERKYNSVTECCGWYKLIAPGYWISNDIVKKLRYFPSRARVDIDKDAKLIHITHPRGTYQLRIYEEAGYYDNNA